MFKYLLVETANCKKHKLRIDDEFVFALHPSENSAIKLSLYKYNEGDVIFSKAEDKTKPFNHFRLSEMEEGYFYKIERRVQ